MCWRTLQAYDPAMNAAYSWTDGTCRNCGRSTTARYCGLDDCTKDLAQSVVRRRAWACRFLFVAVMFGTLAGSLVTFFQRDDWQDWVILWTYRHEQYDVTVAVATGSWGGLSWEAWATVGFAMSAAFVLFWALLSVSAARKERSMPGLKFVVKAEQDERWGALKVLGILAVIPAIIVVLGLFIGVAAAASGDGSHHHDD